LSIFAFEEKPKDDVEPLGLSSSSAPKEKNQDMTMKLPPCRRLLHLKKKM